MQQQRAARRGPSPPPLPETQKKDKAKGRDGRAADAGALYGPRSAVLSLGRRAAARGIQEAVAACAAAAPASLRPLLLSNVLLFGGGAACPGISERLERELRPLVPAAVEVVVRVASSGKEGTRSNGENGENGGGSNVDESKRATMQADPRSLLGGEAPSSRATASGLRAAR